MIFDKNDIKMLNIIKDGYSKIFEEYDKCQLEISEIDIKRKKLVEELDTLRKRDKEFIDNLINKHGVKNILDIKRKILQYAL